MGCVHGDEFRLDANVLALNWTANGVAKLDEPCVSLLIWITELWDQDAIVSKGFDVWETLHVLDWLLVDFGVPEGDAHIVSFGLSVGKHDRVVEVSPNILWLNVGKEDVWIDGKDNSQAEAFPSDAVDDTRLSWDS